MKRFLIFAAAAVMALCVGRAFPQNLDENGALPRATPESVGLSSEAVCKTLDDLNRKIQRIDSVMILRHGKVVAEAWRAPASPNAPHAMYSLSKSFTSIAVGFAVVEEKLAVEQKMIDFFPEELPEDPDPKLKDVTLKHLLTMSCGHASEPRPADVNELVYGRDRDLSENAENWVKKFLAQEIKYEPGTKFVYNTMSTYMCSAIVQKATGEKVVDYLVPRLFEPLAIGRPYWERSPQDVTVGGTGLFLKTEDIAKFGQFLLQKGMWNGRQLLPAEWIEEATAKQVENGSDPNSDWGAGYGYQFWRCRHNAFRGDGKYSQFCLVMPDQDMVVVTTSDTGSSREILDTIFDDLIPAAKDAPLPEDPDAVAKLRAVETSFEPKEAYSGSDILSRSVYSPALQRDVKYRVYIPNEYYTTALSYPTLYLLHGLGGSETDWCEKGDVKATCDAYFADHPFEKRIVVMPDAENSWYRDSLDASSKYESFFFNELIPDVEKHFRCQKHTASRAIAGLSMGGYGSLLYALRHPEMFCACYAMSAAVITPEQARTIPWKDYIRRYRATADQKETDDRLTEYFWENCPHSLITKLSDDQKQTMRFMLDCGDDDSLVKGNIALFGTARINGVKCELRIRDGGHVWEYWKTALPKALEFFGGHDPR